ncbi:MAG: DUF2807 domain-containing protein [bacterium]|nr:DUF2807 domain-containing protein [bacterium]
MLNKINKTTLTIILVVMLSAASAQAWSFGSRGDRIEGSGDLETREFNVDDFDEISMGGAFSLQITFGDRQQVKVTIDDNLWDNLEVDVKSGKLEFDWDESCEPDGDCKIELVVTELKEVSIHGACDAEIEDFRGESFRYNLSGAGSLTMDGEVEDLKIRVSGAGDADTRKLTAENVDISVSGAGNAEVYASKSIKAKVSGVGQITYYGDPEKERTSVSGIGNIRSK